MAKYLDYDGMLYFWSKLKEKFSSIGSAFTPKGSSSTIPSLTSSNIGDVYNMSSEFTTTSDFVEGDGISYPVGTNIICVNSSGTKKWDVLSGFVNLSGYSKTDHNHNGVYSPVGHTHSDYITSQYLGENYYSKTEVDDGFATASHNHDSRYYTESEIDTKLSGKSDTGHTHNDYITSKYLGENYYSKTEINDGFSPIGHNHNTAYYTKTEVDNKLAGKSDSGHTHNDYITSQYLGENYYSKTQIDDGFSPIGHSHNNASPTSAGFIKVSSVKSTSVTVNAESTTAGRYYPVELNGDGKAIVNIPWVNTTYSAATTSSNGLMSSTDKSKLNGIANGATADTAITNSEIDTILAS